jgi:hypothetical protein
VVVLAAQRSQGPRAVLGIAANYRRISPERSFMNAELPVNKRQGEVIFEQ